MVNKEQDSKTDYTKHKCACNLHTGKLENKGATSSRKKGWKTNSSKKEIAWP